MVKYTFIIIADLLDIKYIILNLRYFIDDQQLIALFKFLEVFMFESELIIEPLSCFKVSNY